MKNVALVTICNELLAGKILNSNATFLARKLKNRAVNSVDSSSVWNMLIV